MDTVENDVCTCNVYCTIEFQSKHSIFQLITNNKIMISLSFYGKKRQLLKHLDLKNF